MPHQLQKRARQIKLPLSGQPRGKWAREHGGEEFARRGGRKSFRPFDPGKSLHVTMRALSAVGERSMLHPRRARVIRRIVYRAGERHRVCVRRYVCVGNHLHLLIQTKDHRMVRARPELRAFLREVGGLVARVVTGAVKGRPAGGRFWNHLAWSRVMEWGRALARMHLYLDKNEQDAVAVLTENCWPPDI